MVGDSWSDPVHLYFVNWLPRSLASTFIALCGKHKDYSHNKAGVQRLDEMHYYTWNSIGAILTEKGFSYQDQRILRIKSALQNPLLISLAILLYIPFRFAYFDSFHLLLKKSADTPPLC